MKKVSMKSILAKAPIRYKSKKKNQKVKLSEMSIKFLVAMGKVHALQSVAHHLGANFFPKESGNYRSYESRYMRMRTIEVFNALRK